MLLAAVEKVIYVDEDSGFTVLRLTTMDEDVPVRQPAMGKPARFVGTGEYIPKREGQELKLIGEWKDGGKYGLQFAIEDYRLVLPRSRKGIITYLTTGAFTGLELAVAEGIVEHFGTGALKQIINKPERLLEVPEVDQETYQFILAALAEDESLCELISRLGRYGVTMDQCKWLRKRHGQNALELFDADPYFLVQVPGIDFDKADEIAIKLDVAGDDPRRVCCAIKTTLRKLLSSAGHIFYPKDELVGQVYRMLRIVDGEELVSINEIQKNLGQLHDALQIVCFEERVYFAEQCEQEFVISSVVANMVARKPETGDFTANIRSVAQELGLISSKEQREAVSVCLNERLSILKGEPGSGKTTIIEIIIKVFHECIGGKVLLAAPTGRAAARMSECTKVPAQTLHKMLGLLPDDEDGLEHTTSDQLDADLIIIDESPMMDQNVAFELFSHLQYDARVILVGDENQLPSVGGGCIFKDLINSGVVPVVRLDCVYRQDEGSLIDVNRRRILNGKTNLQYDEDEFEFIPARNAKEASKLIMQAYAKELRKRNVKHVQILSPLKWRGDAAVNQLNVVAQSFANPASAKKREIKFGSRQYRLGDKIIQEKNDEERCVCNGDQGYISDIVPSGAKKAVVKVLFGDDHEVSYSQSELRMIDWGFAMSIHRSQGSEYQIVFLPVLPSFKNMLKRDVYYTGITRARTKVYLVGSKKALAQAIKTPPAERYTALAETTKRIYLRLKDQEDKKAS